MRIIQSLKIDKGIADSSGWMSPEFNWMSWSLSCLQLTKLHGKVELYTNTYGKEVLIDILKLPYYKVHVVLDDVKPCHPSLWAYSKLYVYSLQEEPFLHIDGDVFLWERLPDNLLNVQIAVQNIEIDADNYYSGISEQVNNADFLLPDCITKQQLQEKQIFAYNCGIVGGNDIAFIKKYTNAAFEFINSNAENITKLQTPEKLNVYFEQYLLYCLAKENNIQPTYYYQQAVGPMNYKNHFFVNFLDVPYKTKFIHTIGTFKQNIGTCLMLAKRLRKDYPERYSNILDSCHKSGIQTIIKQPDTFSNIKENKLTFYRTKINLVGVDEIRLKALSDADLPNIINRIASIEIKEKLLDLYEYEKQLERFENNIDIKDLDKIQQQQNELLEKVFSDTNFLHNLKFVVDSNLHFIPVNRDYTTKWFLQKMKASGDYKMYLPTDALLGSHLEVFCDELDIQLLNTLKMPKSLEEIKIALLDNFDANEITQNPESYDFLVLSRIKYAMFNNLILCIDNEYHQGKESIVAPIYICGSLKLLQADHLQGKIEPYALNGATL